MSHDDALWSIKDKQIKAIYIDLTWGIDLEGLQDTSPNRKVKIVTRVFSPSSHHYIGGAIAALAKGLNTPGGRITPCFLIIGNAQVSRGGVRVIDKAGPYIGIFKQTSKTKTL